MGRTRVRTEHVDTSRDSGYDKFCAEQRNLGENLQGCIFGCTAQTKNECVQGLIFGLPSRHWLYVENIFQGMPLFLFNYSTKELYGIFQAQDDAQWELNPSGWSRAGGKTQYPAQVRVKLVEQCPALQISELMQLLTKNFDSKKHLIFELDMDDVKKLMRKSIMSGGKSKDYVERRMSEILKESKRGWNKWYGNTTQEQAATKPTSSNAVASSSSQVVQGVQRPNFSQPVVSNTEINRPRGAWSRPLPSLSNICENSASIPEASTPKIVPNAPANYSPETSVSTEGQWGANLCATPPSTTARTEQRSNSIQSSRNSNQNSQNTNQQNNNQQDTMHAQTSSNDVWGMSDDQWGNNQWQNTNNNNNNNNTSNDTWQSDQFQNQDWSRGNNQQGNNWGDDQAGNDTWNQTNQFENSNQNSSKNTNNNNNSNSKVQVEEQLVRRRGSSSSNQNSEKSPQKVQNSQSIPSASENSRLNAGNAALNNEQNSFSNENVQNNSEISFSNNIQNTRNIPQSMSQANEQNQALNNINNGNIINTDQQPNDMHALQSDVQQLLQKLVKISPELAYAVQLQFFSLIGALDQIQNELVNSQVLMNSFNQKFEGDMFGAMQLQFQQVYNKQQICSNHISDMKDHYGAIADQIQCSLQAAIQNDQNIVSRNSGSENSQQQVPKILKQELYIVGGVEGGSTWTNCVDVFDGVNWSSRCVLPSKCAYGGAAANKKYIYSAGGGKFSDWYNTSYRYSLQDDTWTQISIMNFRRGSLAMVSVKEKIFVLGGGEKIDDAMVQHNSAEVFDEERNVWQEIWAMNSQRFMVAAEVAHNAIFAVGGYNGKYLQSYERLDVREGKWVEFPDVIQEKRGGHRVAAYKDNIIIAGGYDGKNFHDKVELLETRMNKIIQLKPIKQNRVYGVLACMGDNLYSLGGMSRSGSQQDIEVLNLVNGEDWYSLKIEEQDLPRIRGFTGSCVVNTYE